MFSIIILDFVTLGFPILFSSDNKTVRPSKPPRLKLNSKCFSANPLSPILVTVCLDAYDLDFPLTFVFAASSNLERVNIGFPIPNNVLPLNNTDVGVGVAQFSISL